jgi:hypothetical protein
MAVPASPLLWGRQTVSRNDSWTLPNAALNLVLSKRVLATTLVILEQPSRHMHNLKAFLRYWPSVDTALAGQCTRTRRIYTPAFQAPVYDSGRAWYSPLSP